MQIVLPSASSRVVLTHKADCSVSRLRDLILGKFERARQDPANTGVKEFITKPLLQEIEAGTPTTRRNTAGMMDTMGVMN